MYCVLTGKVQEIQLDKKRWVPELCGLELYIISIKQHKWIVALWAYNIFKLMQPSEQFYEMDAVVIPDL